MLLIIVDKKIINMVHIKEYDEFLNEALDAEDITLMGLFLGGIGVVAFGLYHVVSAMFQKTTSDKILDIIHKHLTEEERTDLSDLIENDKMIKKYDIAYQSYFSKKYETSLDMLSGTVTKTTIVSFINAVNNDKELQKHKDNLNKQIIKTLTPKYIKQFNAINDEVSELIGEKYNYLEGDILKSIFGKDYKKQFDIK